jgi:hypothetical protein
MLLSVVGIEVLRSVIVRRQFFIYRAVESQKV